MRKLLLPASALIFLLSLTNLIRNMSHPVTVKAATWYEYDLVDYCYMEGYNSYCQANWTSCLMDACWSSCDEDWSGYFDAGDCEDDCFVTNYNYACHG